ncbi:hypothetical protein JXVLWARM_CDS_0085 [Burkholderia phage Bm1]
MDDRTKQRQADLDLVTHITGLLCGAADAIGAANYAIRSAKELASQIEDAEIRRKVMQVAGTLKADATGFYE